MSLAAPDLGGLMGLVAEDRVLIDPAERRARSRDWWPLARLREVRGDVPVTPAAVVLPTTTQEVAAVLAWATRTGTAVVPRGLGSGVCGGVMPDATGIVLELSRMSRVLEIDLESRIVHVEAGIRGDVLEKVLAGQGATLGHYPQSIEISTVGGWISAWSAGQASPGYGQIEDRLVGMTVVLPDGDIVSLRPRPRAAAGPDFRRLFLGAEGGFGVVTEAWLSFAEADPAMTWQAFAYPSFEAVLRAGRDIQRGNIGERVNRGWDEADTAWGFHAQVPADVRCLGLVGIPSSAPGLNGRRDATATIAARHGGALLDADVGDRWWARRLDAVDVFERLMGPGRELGPGSLIDTFEPSALWRDLPAMYEAVRSALTAYTEHVRCHFSHVYSSGAALYFTFILQAGDDHAAESAYVGAWRAALDACLGAGGSVGHHHGLGRLKGATYARDIGASAAALASRLKTTLDPAGILNQGVLAGASELESDA